MLRSFRQSFELRKLGSAVAAIAIVYSVQLFSPSQAQQPQPTNLPPGVLPQAKVAAPQAELGTDIVCERLLADYILRQVKIDSSDIEAAMHLVASRGRANGYWRTVLKHFQESKINDFAGSPSSNLLKILTKMLATDGNARWSMAHPDPNRASIPRIALSNEVLDTIIARAKEADRMQFDAYILAVVAAHDTRSKKFLLEVLNDAAATSRNYLANPGGGPASFRYFNFNTLTHAAIGLANLGERAGLAWLIETPMSDSPEVRLRLGALADLTGLKFQTFEEWQAWWKTNPIGETFEPKSRARVRNQ